MDRRPLGCFVGVLIFFASAALARSVSLPSPTYRPGRYLPLRIETDTAGVVRVGGDGVQAVDWPAAGKSSVVVPLLVTADAADGLSLVVNGRSVRLELHALGPADIDPPELLRFWPSIDPSPPTGPATDDDAYALAALWQPGRDAATRNWSIAAVAVVVLTLGVAAHADPKRATRWLVVAGVVLSVGAIAAFPADAPRRVLNAEGRPGWEWVWHAATSPRVAVELWTPGLRFVPSSGEAAKSVDATLHCDAVGRPVSISANLGRDGRGVLIRPTE